MQIKDVWYQQFTQLVSSYSTKEDTELQQVCSFPLHLHADFNGHWESSSSFINFCLIANTLCSVLILVEELCLNCQLSFNYFSQI